MASGSVTVSTLPPNPPPDRAADEMKLVRGHIEDLRAGVEREEQSLRRRVDDIATVGVGGCDRAVGFGRRVLDRRHLIALFENVIRRGEAALDVAEANLLVVVDVVVGEGVFGIGLIDHRRAGLHRLLDVKDRRQRFVVNADLRQGLEGFALAVRDDGDDRLALVANLVDGERRLVILAEIDQAEQRIEIARHVGATDDPAHAGAALRFGKVDAANARMGVGAAQDLEMQHALQLVVVEISRGRGDMAEHVLSLSRLANLLEIVVALVGKNVFAQFKHKSPFQARRSPRRAAAARTALMIGS